MQATEQYLTAWAAAEPAGGTGAQETRLASGCTAAGPLGFTLPKQAWLARHRSGDRIYQDCSSEEVRGRAISQDTKAVTAHQRPRQRPGPPDPEATRATLVLASNAGRRPLAAIHMSFIAGTRGRPAISGPGGSRPQATAARHERPGWPDSIGYRQRDPGRRATGDAGRPALAVSPITPTPSAEPVTPGRGHGAAGHRRAA